MAVIHENVWPNIVPPLDCGSNNYDGHATAIAESRTKAVAIRQARSRVRTLKNRRWRQIRRLRCPRRPKDCRRKEITYIYSPAPNKGREVYFRARRVWRVQYNIRWMYRVDCLVPFKAFATRVKLDTDKFWKAVSKKKVAAGSRRNKK